MAVRNIFASHSGIPGDRGSDLAARLLLTGWASMVPMTALSAGMPKESISNTSFSWIEDDQTLTHTIATVVANTVITTITVEDSNVWLPSSILLNHNTGEQMYVTAVAGNVVTVVRGHAGTVPTAIAVGNRIQQVGSAFPEGSRGAASVMTQGETRTSYVQIFKTAWSVTGTAGAVNFITGNKEAEAKSQAMDRLTNQMEEAAILGRPSVSRITTPDGIQELRTSAGLDYSIRTFGGQVVVPAAQSVVGRLNLDIFNTFIRKIFDRQIKGQPNERMTFCGSSFVALIQSMIMDLGGYRFESMETEFGIKVISIITPNGTLKLMTHPMFLSSPALQNELMVWHPGGVKRKVLRDVQVIPRDIKVMQNAQDANTGDILIEMGLEFKGMVCSGILSGTQTAGGLAKLPVV